MLLVPLNISGDLFRCLAESRPSGRNGRERERERESNQKHNSSFSTIHGLLSRFPSSALLPFFFWVGRVPQLKTDYRKEPGKRMPQPLPSESTWQEHADWVEQQRPTLESGASSYCTKNQATKGTGGCGGCGGGLGAQSLPPAKVV